MASGDRERRGSAERTIAAPLGDCLGAILDVEAYPRWVRGYRRAEVEEADGEGRPVLVAFEVGRFGLSAGYRLAYDHGRDPVTVSFHQVEGNLTRSIEGRYRLIERGPEETRVSYEASVELALGLPGPLARAAERIVIDAALGGLEKEVGRRRSRR